MAYQNSNSVAPQTAMARIVTGAGAGLIAGLVASFAMDRFQALTQPSGNQDSEPATDRAANAVVRTVTGEGLSQQAKPIGGQLVHYGLGAILGVGYGVAAELDPRATAGAGTAFAAVSWAILDEAAVPAVGLGAPPWQSPATTQGYGLVSHLVFGVVAEQVRRLARRLASRAVSAA